MMCRRRHTKSSDSGVMYRLRLNTFSRQKVHVTAEMHGYKYSYFECGRRQQINEQQHLVQVRTVGL